MESFYIHAIDFLEALDIDTEVAEDSLEVWRQLKMI